MGMHLSIYIGAYLKLNTNEEIDEDGPPKCSHHPKKTFKDSDVCCSACGAVLTRQVISRRVRWYDLFSDSEEEFEDVLNWIPDENEKGPSRFLATSEVDNERFPDHIKHELEYGGNIEILPDMAMQFVDNFKKNYWQIIQILEKNERVLRIEFGVVTYYM